MFISFTRDLLIYLLIQQILEQISGIIYMLLDTGCIMNKSGEISSFMKCTS